MTAAVHQDSAGARQRPSQHRAPSPAEWDGVSHGRMTRKMTQARLPFAARVLLAEIHRKIPIGTWAAIPNAWWARALGMSESTVSRNMALLAGETVDADGRPLNPTPFIARRRREDGKPGLETCPLPPPELRPKPRRSKPAAEPAAPSQTGFFDHPRTDPVRSIPPEGIRTPESGGGDHAPADGCIFLDHACSGSSKGGAPEHAEPDSDAEQPAELSSTPSTHAEVAAPARVIPLPAVMPPGLRQLGLLDAQWPALRRFVGPYSYGLAELVRDLRLLRERTDPISPFALIRTALLDGVPIFSRAEYEAQQAELAALLGRVPLQEVPRGRGDRPVDGGGGADAGGGPRAAPSGRGGRRVPDGPRAGPPPDRAGGSAPAVHDAPPLTPERAAAIRAAAAERVREKQRRRC